MSRAGYSDGGSEWDMIRWRGAVASATRGSRGQAFLKELLAALDAMPVKELIANSFATETGAHCTLGVIGAARGLDMPKIDDDDYFDDEIREEAAAVLNIAPALAAEIMFENDEGSWGDESPAKRWARMRNWVVSQIREPA